MMRRLLSDDYYGIFSPRGELEAVDTTLFLAECSARNLSPNPNQPNRHVTRVEIWLPDDGTAAQAAPDQPASPDASLERAA
jgi:hypothetical protein